MSCENVLLVTVDSLRADAVRAKPHGESVTPRIGELADRGVRFEEAIANGSNTPTSFPSILTSTYPLMYGGFKYLDDSRPFVAEQLSEAGFETVAYHSNPHLGPNWNYDRGFERFNDRGDAAEHSDVGAINRLRAGIEERLDNDSAIYGVLRRIWHLFSMSTGTAAYANATSITDSALDWLEEWNGKRRFFLWLHYMDVHYPFMPPAEHLEAIGADVPGKRRVAKLNGQMHENPEQISDLEQLLDLYYGEVRYADHEVGRLLDALSERGALDSTLVAVTGDHGEAFGEHGEYGHHPTPYEELVRVPLVLAGPDAAGEETVTEQVELADVGPTVYECVDVPIPDPVQGRSLAPLFQGDGGSAEDPVAICTGSRTVLASRTSRWKCIWNIETDAMDLYDLTDDPEETLDVADDNPGVVENFKEVLEDHLDEVATTETEHPDVTVSSETEARLRDLGYVE